MKREQLTQLVKTAAETRDYAFHTGDEHLINSTLRTYPAAWLCPPVVKSKSGRTEGEVTWRVTLHLLTLPTGAATAENTWQELEKDALSLAADIALSPAVCSVSNVDCTPARGSLTVHGETSVALALDVTMWYIL
jgi:hypothetical protein